MNGFIAAHSNNLDNRHEKFTNTFPRDLSSLSPGRLISIQASAVAPECVLFDCRNEHLGGNA